MYAAWDKKLNNWQFSDMGLKPYCLYNTKEEGDNALLEAYNEKIKGHEHEDWYVGCIKDIIDNLEIREYV